MKTIKAKCKKCGEVEVSGYFVNSGEEGFIVPVKLCPTIQSLGKFYKNTIGGTYEWNTGNKISASFEKVVVELNHMSVDDGEEASSGHTLEPMECWEEQI